MVFRALDANEIKSHEIALNFFPFLLSVKHLNGRGSFRCGYPSVLTNPSGWYRWVLTKLSVCGYCSVLSPFLNTRTPPWIWFRSRNGNDIFESFSIHKLSKAYAPATEVEKDSSAKTQHSVTSDPIVFKKKPITDVAGNISKLKATLTIIHGFGFDTSTIDFRILRQNVSIRWDL